MVRDTSSVMGAQEQRPATGPWVPFPRGVRAGQWPERRCTLWGYLGMATCRGMPFFFFFEDLFIVIG